MKLTDIFEVFSRRKRPVEQASFDIPESTRNRIFLWCADIFSNRRTWSGGNDITGEFWDEIHRTLQMRHGKTQLSDARAAMSSRATDTITFLSACPSSEFLDFLEYIFRVDCYFHVSLPDDQVVNELNDILRVDDLPFYITNFVRETVREVANVHPFAGREMDVIKIRAYPTVISRESEVIHTNITEPALRLLQNPIFNNANSEYLEALDDFRKGDFSDSLTKCCSAFESVLKVVCQKKGWNYHQSDTANTLIKIIIENSALENYFESVLTIVATLRNRLSKAHGAGTQSRYVPRHIAAYALNSTATSILLIVSEVGMQ